MKLKDILTENSEGYVVYKVSSPKMHEVYYGYSKGDPKKIFMAGANRNAADRTEAKYIAKAGGEEHVTFKELEIFDSEYEAFMERNDLRAKDSDSITGPSNQPSGMYQRALKEDPERVKRWKTEGDIEKLTAKQAWNHDAFKAEINPKIKELSQRLSKDPKQKKQATDDLDKLTWPQYEKKYFS